MSLSPSAHLHLEWIKKHPSFVPDIPLRAQFKTYYDDMQDFWTWNSKICPGAVPMMANRWLLDDIRLMDTYEARLRAKKVELGISDRKLEFFCTIGFNHQTYTIAKCVDVINKILSFDWVLKCRAVFEYYRENGEHPHVHFLITTTLTKSKVIEKIWATGGIKQIVLANRGIKPSTFIDVKPAERAHHKYIMLDKQEKKMSYVAKDIIWRRENSIPEFFEK